MRQHKLVPTIVLGVAVAALASTPVRADAPSPVTAPAAATIDVKPVVGSQSLAISGTAPAGQSVRVTLYATLSRDIPDVTLSSTTVRAGNQGTFATTLSFAPAFFRGALVTAVASVLPAGPSATAHWTVVAPNVTVPPDNLPYQVR